MKENLIDNIVDVYSTMYDSSDFKNVLKNAASYAFDEGRKYEFQPVIDKMEEVINNLGLLRDANKALDNSIIDLYAIVNDFKLSLQEQKL